MIPYTGGFLDYVAEIVPVVGTFLISFLGLFIKNQLAQVRITQLEQEARLIGNQNKVKEELVQHQSDIKNTITEHIAEDRIYHEQYSEDIRELKNYLKK